jgi:hypothetical protein
MADINAMNANDQALLSGQILPSIPTPSNSVPIASSQSASQPISNPAPQPVASQPAPTVEQSGKTQGTDTKPVVQPSASSGQSEPKLSDEQLLTMTGLVETPSQKVARLEREHSGATKEARRRAEREKRITEMLESQGIKLVEDENKSPIGFIPTKNYGKDVEGSRIEFSRMSAEDQKLFLDSDNPQKIIDKIQEQDRKAFIKVVPTTMQEPILPIDQSLHQETVNHLLKDEKYLDGDLKYPGLENNLRVIEMEVNRQGTPQMLKDFYNAPETHALAVSLLHLYFQNARNHNSDVARKAVEAAAIKAAERDKNPTPAPTGGGTPTLGNPQSSGNPYVDSMNQAMDEISRERARPKQ